MANKIIFIDLDGTLLLPNKPLSSKNVEALKVAKENGHKLFICTGRNYVGIEKEVLDIGFNGIISSAGGYITIDNKVISTNYIDPKLLKDICEVLIDNDVEYSLEGTNETFVTSRLVELVATNDDPSLSDEDLKKVKKIFVEQFNMKPIEEFNDELIHKVSFMADTKKALQNIKDNFSEQFLIVIHELFSKDSYNGELVFHDVNKGTGISEVLSYLKLENVDTIGIGDSMNDSHMFETCTYNIAIKHAPEELKNLANHVTVDCHQDAIYHAFKHLEII